MVRNRRNKEESRENVNEQKNDPFLQLTEHNCADSFDSSESKRIINNVAADLSNDESIMWKVNSMNN